MPEHRLTKTRATLPEGYQYGDAGETLVPVPLRLRPLLQRMADQHRAIEGEARPRPVRRVDWNVIEGDPV